jgi:hypothetical protein
LSRGRGRGCGRGCGWRGSRSDSETHLGIPRTERRSGASLRKHATANRTIGRRHSSKVAAEGAVRIIFEALGVTTTFEIACAADTSRHVARKQKRDCRNEESDNDYRRTKLSHPRPIPVGVRRWGHPVNLPSPSIESPAVGRPGLAPLLSPTRVKAQGNGVADEATRRRRRRAGPLPLRAAVAVGQRGG